MSSHHIIREDQEPALVIDDASPENLATLQQLLEWSPTVIATEQALERVLTWGIKIDVAVVQEANLEKWKILLQEQVPIKILTSPSHNETPEIALLFLVASKQRVVNVISNCDVEAFEKFLTLDVAVIRNGRRWVFIRSGRFEKWLPAGTEVRLYPKRAHPEPVVEKEGMVTVHRDCGFWLCEIN
jgi:thiamine pyrophosphokinase